MFDNFPYTNFHEMNLDWMIKIAKDFLDQYTHIQETITQGLEDLDQKAQDLEQLLQAWYDEHSQDIADQLADALNDLNDWYTEHQGYLDQYLQDSIAAFNDAAEQKAAQTIQSIPADYTEMYNNYQGIVENSQDDNLSWLAVYKGKYIYINGNMIDNARLMCSDFVAIPDNVEAVRIYGITTVGEDVYTNSPAAVFYNEAKQIVKYASSADTTEEYITVPVNSNIKYIRFNLSMQADDADKILCRFIKFSRNETDYVGTYTFNLTSSNRFETEYLFRLKAGVAYKIVCLNQDPIRCRFFPHATNSIYADIDTFNQETVIKWDDADYFLRGYNVSNLAEMAVTIAVYEYTANPITTTKEVYFVSKQRLFQAHQVYTSLTQCLLDLKDNRREKTIYIDGGDYDIFAEYQAANVPVYTGNDPTYDYFDYCVWVPANTHIIGLGNVRLTWDPPATDTTWQECQCVSPLNVVATATIENIDVICRNGRYCLHNDGLGEQEYIGAIQKYINVRFYKYTPAEDASGTYGKHHTIGFGLDAMQHLEFDNCEFYNQDPDGIAFYGHDRPASGGGLIDYQTSGNIVVKNSVINSLNNDVCTRLDNTTSNANIYIKTTFASCYFSGVISLPIAEAQNAFDISLIRCNQVTVNKANPRYPVKVY